MRKQIEKVLNSELTGYRIEQLTKVPQSTISNLRNGKSDLGNLTLNKAEALAAIGNGIESAEKVYTFMKDNFKEIDSSTESGFVRAKFDLGNAYQARFMGDIYESVVVVIYKDSGKIAEEFYTDADGSGLSFTIENLKAKAAMFKN